jgi:cation transport ATPase
MKRSKLRLNPVTEFLVYLIFGLLLGTGVAWIWAQTSLDEGSHVSSLMLKLHGAAAMAALILLGALINHVRKGWKARKNRSSGITLLTVILFLTVTGYGLYYAGDEQLRSLISRWHTWIGLAVFLLIPVHVLIGRALRRKRSQGSAGIAGNAGSAEAPTTQSRTVIGEK